jgi:NagD protein
MKELQAKNGFICDMDGVIYHGNKLLPGAMEFVNWLTGKKKNFLFLTNNSSLTPRELKLKLERLGIEVGEQNFYTSALATASFLKNQCPGGSAYVIGDAGVINALYDVGFMMNDINPDYVVVGESRDYNFDKIDKAVRLVMGGAKLIGCNYDLTSPTEKGIGPACRALTAPIEMATGRPAYFVGKPNPLMMRSALRRLNTGRDETVIIGDRMDTDIVAGIESDLETVLVLSGVTTPEIMEGFPYRPTYVLQGVGDILK